MPKYFSITAVTVSIELNAAKREGQASFTVTNATQASFGGDAIVEPPDGSDDDYKKQFAKLQFEVENPSRHYDPGAAEQITVKITAPPDLPKGSYPFVLRMLLAGGIPEEQYDDAPVVTVVVPAMPPTDDGKKRNFPWWIFAIAAAVAVVIIGLLVFVTSCGGPTPSPSPTPTATPTSSGTQSPNPSPFTSTIDFSVPSLGSAERLLVNPYVAQGVTFTAIGTAAFTPVVGLVRNSATSACAEPADDNAKLATGVDSSSIGLSAFPIQASFAQPLQPTGGPVRISVEFQTGADVTVRVRLLGLASSSVGQATAVANPPAGTCGFPGSQRARITVTAESNAPVTSVVMDTTSGGRVFVIDNFTFQGALP